MSTYDVPGANPANGDTLKQGCWAESTDGSLLFVESTENGRVIYSVFDMSKSRVIEYRDAMDETLFKTRFTGKGSSAMPWIWHDKTPFPWDSVIKKGAEDGGRLASADDILDQAAEIAESRRRLSRRSMARTAAQQVADEEGLTGNEILNDDLARRGRRFGASVPHATRRLADGLAQLLDQYFGDRG
jgi:hypothetical protein